MKEQIKGLTGLKNIGEVTAKALASVDIFTREDIVKLGPANIYHILKAHGYEVTIVLVYALQGAIMDLHWNELSVELKKSLQKQIATPPFESL